MQLGVEKGCNPPSRSGPREAGSPWCAEKGHNNTWRVACCLGLCVSQNSLETQSWCCELKGGLITPNLVAAWLKAGCLSSPRLASASRRIPGEPLVFSPHWSVEETGF